MSLLEYNSLAQREVGGVELTSRGGYCCSSSIFFLITIPLLQLFSGGAIDEQMASFGLFLTTHFENDSFFDINLQWLYRSEDK